MSNMSQRTERASTSAVDASRCPDLGADGNHGRYSSEPIDQKKALESRIKGLVRSSEKLTNEMLEIIPHLHASTQPASQADGSALSKADVRQHPTERALRNVVLARRQRDRYFDASLFADPAWDILLDLAIAEYAQVRVCITDLCVGASVPHTTALRWIKRMTDDGLLNRQDDPLDARRKFIELSHSASAQMQTYLRSLNGGDTPVI